MTLGWPMRTVTIGRLGAIEITLNWRWAPVLVLGTWLLAQNVLPASFPAWAVGTTWLTSAAVVLAGEAALLLHELSHAVAAHGRGQEVLRIVFHGFRAETVVSPGLPAPAHEALIALVGPAMNLALGGLAAILRGALATQGPLDLVLLTLVLGNAAMAVMSLVPLSGSDGKRAVNAFYRARLTRLAVKCLEVEVAGERQDQHDQDQQAERRPTVVTPTPRMAEATAKERHQKQDDKQCQDHGCFSPFRWPASAKPMPARWERL